jgi:hypothetical protein
VQRRFLQSDPVLIRVFGGYTPFLALLERLYVLLLGEEPTVEVGVQAAIASGAVGAAVVHPLVADLGDDTLRTELMRSIRRLPDIPATEPAPS